MNLKKELTKQMKVRKDILDRKLIVKESKDLCIIFDKNNKLLSLGRNLEICIDNLED